MYKQTDERWNNYPINGSKTTIGQVGCLLTSLCNAFNKNTCSDVLNPIELDTHLIKNNGYTTDNLIIWSVADKVLQAKSIPYFTGKEKYSIKDFYIANYLNPRVGHFTNIISIDGDKYTIFDVYDGEIKVIQKPRRIVKVTF